MNKEFKGDILPQKGYLHNVSREMLKDVLIKQREIKESQEKYPWVKIPGVKVRPCLHDECSECNGSGRKKNGQICVHMISCPCPKCTPYYL
jgi:hypothetical protein